MFHNMCIVTIISAIVAQIVCGYCIAAGDSTDDDALLVRRIAVYSSANPAQFACARSASGNKEVYILAIKPRSATSKAEGKWEVRRSRWENNSWSTAETVGILRAPFGISTASEGVVGVMSPAEGSAVIVYTAQGRAGIAGILPYLEYPFLAIGCVQAKRGHVSTTGLNAAEEAKNLEMRLYGPMHLVDVCTTGAERWLVLSRSGHVFVAAPDKKGAKAAARQPMSLPATTGCGVHMLMVGGVDTIADMKPLDSRLPTEKPERRDKGRCHGFGQPKGATCLVLCSRNAKGDSGKNARILEIHRVTRDVAGAMSSSVMAKTEMAAEMSSLVALEMESSHEGELWWCCVAKTQGSQEILVGRCESSGKVSWQHGISTSSGTLVGGFVDRDGSVSAILSRMKGGQVEVVEISFGHFKASREDKHDMSQK